uniref:HOOK domain-containing protein n=1 Tax=Elaeophora elaphi TaxID=1147741 RepID=A0A0R3RXE2_9BILA
LDEEKKEVKSLKNLNAELNAKFESLSLGQKPEIVRYDSIQQQWSNEEMDKKNDEICKLNKQIDDLKWSLGEHKQWLADANNRLTISKFYFIWRLK